jgi:hypothetical protein
MFIFAGRLKLMLIVPMSHFNLTSQEPERVFTLTFFKRHSIHRIAILLVSQMCLSSYPLSFIIKGPNYLLFLAELINMYCRNLIIYSHLTLPCLLKKFEIFMI